MTHKRNQDVNSIEHWLDNPILDTLLYYVKFLDDEVTPLTVDAIAQEMNDQCKIDGNEYLLLEIL